MSSFIEGFNEGSSIGAQGATNYRIKIGEFDENGNITRAGKLNLLIKVAKIAVLTIGTVAIAGCMPASATGWSLIGLGGGIIALSLLGGKLKDRVSDLTMKAIFSAYIITMGVLGIIGILPGTLIGVFIISGIASNLIYCFCSIKNEIDKITSNVIYIPLGQPRSNCIGLRLDALS